MARGRRLPALRHEVMLTEIESASGDDTEVSKGTQRCGIRPLTGREIEVEGVRFPDVTIVLTFRDEPVVSAGWIAVDERGTTYRIEHVVPTIDLMQEAYSMVDENA